LEDVARKELGIGKLPRSSVTDMIENDPEKLVAYNLIDVYITAEINKKNGVINFHQTLAELAGCSLDGTKYNSNLVDSFLLHFIDGRVALPSKGMLTSVKIEAGGKVHEASTGLRKNVAVVDLSRAYPTTIQVNNLSPETKLGYACDVCEYSSSCEEEKIATGCDKWMTHTECYKMPSGRCYAKGKPGLVPATFIQLIDRRKKYQKLMKEGIKDGDKEKEDKFFEMQRAVKYLMNSFYGVLGSINKDTGKGKFRLADGEIGSDVTESIRLLNGWIENHLADVTKLEKYMIQDKPTLYNGYIKLMKEDIIPIYGDTDSVLFEFPTSLDGEELDGDLVIELINLITLALNRSFEDFSRQLSGSEINLYEVEFEKFYATFFQGGKKKRYAGLFAWKKGVWMTDRSFSERKDVRGYEIRRSDASKFTKEYQAKLFEIILTTQNKKEVSLAIQDWMNKFYNCEFDFKIPKGISKTEYKKTMPIQMRAAAYSNSYLGKDFRPPTKVFYCYMKSVDNGPGSDVIGLEIDDDPRDYGEPDLDIMFEKCFHKPFGRIVDVVWGEGTLREMEDGMVQTGLEEFY